MGLCPAPRLLSSDSPGVGSRCSSDRWEPGARSALPASRQPGELALRSLATAPAAGPTGLLHDCALALACRRAAGEGQACSTGLPCSCSADSHAATAWKAAIRLALGSTVFLAGSRSPQLELAARRGADAGSAGERRRPPGSAPTTSLLQLPAALVVPLALVPAGECSEAREAREAGEARPGPA